MPSPSRSRKEKESWWSRAENFEKALANAPSGKRDIAAQEYALSNHIAVDTLRTYSVAHRYILRLQPRYAELAIALQGAPVLAVVALSRWETHDEDGAVQAAQRLASGRYSVRALIKEERAARKPPVGRSASKDAWLARLRAYGSMSWAADAVRAEASEEGAQWGGSFTAATSSDKPFKVDLFAGDAPDRRVALAVVGPYANPKHYIDRARDWCLHASALSIFYLQSGLLLPADCNPHIYRQWLSDARQAAPRLRVLLAQETSQGEFIDAMVGEDL
jgi:hypothetical protein